MFTRKAQRVQCPHAWHRPAVSRIQHLPRPAIHGLSRKPPPLPSARSSRVKLLHPIAAFLLWQSALLVNIGAVATPEHLRYQRAVLLPRDTEGLACVTLDVTVLAHTASAAHNDLRVFRGYPGRLEQAEVPYILTESGPEPVANAEATVEHLTRNGNALEFDLRMPPRAYSEVQLRIRAHDFVATAQVSGTDAHGRRSTLGSFGIFDLSREGLGHWTVLPMAETSLAVLHVRLTFRTPDGLPVRQPPFDAVGGASVPPSRERQTLYTPVATTNKVTRQGNATVAVLHVPAHVPVEEVRFTFAPTLHSNFARQVSIRARPDGEPLGDTELIDAGVLEEVNIPSGDPGLNPIHVDQNTLDATIGANLANSATVRVLVADRNQPPLPIRQVALEMRERKACFLAQPGAEYMLRYGDPVLAAPMYDNTALSAAKQPAVEAGLGLEQRNPHWVPRPDERPFFDRNPELFWLIVLVCGGMMAGSALHFVQHREGATGL